MSTNQFNPYRDRLVKKGLVGGSVYGHVSFTLPLFERYVTEHSQGNVNAGGTFRPEGLTPAALAALNELCGVMANSFMSAVAMLEHASRLIIIAHADAVTVRELLG